MLSPESLTLKHTSTNTHISHTHRQTLAPTGHRTCKPHNAAANWSRVTKAVYFKDVTWNDEATWVQDMSLIVHVLLGWTLKKEGRKNKKNTQRPGPNCFLCGSSCSAACASVLCPINQPEPAAPSFTQSHHFLALLYFYFSLFFM